MSVVTIMLAAIGAITTPISGATALRCALALPAGKKFQLVGRFDATGLHSNISKLIQVEGDLTPAIEEVLVINDGTERRRWSLNDKVQSQKFDASLTQYGSEVAVFILEKHKFVGRHWGRTLIGVGFCDVRRSRTSGKVS